MTKTEDEEADEFQQPGQRLENDAGQEDDKPLAMEAWVLMELCSKGNLLVSRNGCMVSTVH